jgi:DNA-binding transcriptional MocR family regulator
MRTSNISPTSQFESIRSSHSSVLTRLFVSPSLFLFAMGSISVDSPKSLINLQLGWPSPRLFAAGGLLDGANEVLKSESETASALVYGPHVGHPPLRQSVADWLSSVYSTPIEQERICISNGASANLSNILLKFTDPLYTRRIFMVEPTYFLACPIFEDNGFQGKMRGVPEDNEEGLDIEFLRRQLDAAEKATGALDAPILKTGGNYPKIYKYIIYLVPTFSNPSAKTLSIQMRKRLVSLAREYDALVVSDDVYDFLSWPEDPSALDDAVAAIPPRLVDIDREMPGYTRFGNTVSNGSFSKIIGPGVRVGWAEGTPAFTKELAEVYVANSSSTPFPPDTSLIQQSQWLFEFRRGAISPHIYFRGQDAS